MAVFGGSWLAIGPARLWLGLALALVASLAAVGVACNGDGEEGDVEDAVRAIVDAWNAEDVDAFLAGWTDNGFMDEFDATLEEGRQFLPEFIGDPPATVRKISNIKVSGDTATAEVELVFGTVLDPERDSFVKEGGVWKIDGTENLTPEIPGDVTAIDLSLAEFAFSFDTGAVTSDETVAFRVKNVGEQPHEIVLVKVPEDFDLEQALQSEEEPEGIEDIAFLDPQDPGSTTNMVFSEPLEPGRYVMVCFIEDSASGQPHALLGMVADFTVP